MADPLKTWLAPLRWVQNRIDPPAVILIYHRVTRLSRDPQQLAVSPEHFREQVEIIKGEYEPVDADTFAFNLKQRRKFSPKTLLITFDDGYADNYLEAWPILEAFQVPALFYITTSLPGTSEEIWWDELERILMTGSSLPSELQLSSLPEGGRFATVNEDNLKASYLKLQNYLRFRTPDQIQEILGELRSWAGAGREGRPTHRFLEPEQIHSLSRSPGTLLGCHTHRHPALGLLPFEQQLEEIRTSRKILESWTGLDIRHFSYPFGSRKFLGTRRYYNRDSIRACRELGFSMVCANYYGQVHSWSNPLVLPRCLVRDWNGTEFRSRLKGFFNS